MAVWQVPRPLSLFAYMVPRPVTKFLANRARANGLGLWPKNVHMLGKMVQAFISRGKLSHLRFACRNVCKWDQNGVK